MLSSISRETLSHVFGTSSLVVWIFAQSPQIWKNHKTRSVEGLSFVFLLQWTLGDMTNILGAVLTHQLPIQIVIAAYMLLVDLSLCLQYWCKFTFACAHPAGFYKPPPPSRPHLVKMGESAPLLAPPRRVVGPTRQASLAPHPDSRRYRAASMDPWSVYRVHVAKRPGKDQSMDRTRASRSRTRYSHSRDTVADSEEQTTESTAGTPHRGRKRDRRRLRAAPMMTHSIESLPSRPRRASLDDTMANIKPSRNAMPPSLSRRGTAMVLLGVWMFMSVSPPSWAPSTSISSTSVTAPAILGSMPSAPPTNTMGWHDSRPMPELHTATDLSAAAVEWSRHPVLLYLPSVRHRRRSRHGHGLRSLPPSVIIGRVFAWLCTLLYMTSRLPQIWANFKRRSVRGLSVLLFVLAFLANLFYSLSVITNPKARGPQRHAYLTESLPFLLGSGGTLVFDMIIIVQYWMYYQRSEKANDLAAEVTQEGTA